MRGINLLYRSNINHQLNNQLAGKYRMSSSQINNSLSKQLYSFSKAERFTKTPQSPCKERFYNYKLQTKTDRSTSFGYGQKTDLANKEPVPPPGTYDAKGEFVQNINKRRGHAFSRHSKRSIINQEQSLKLPGPGQYNADKDIKYSHIKYSFRPKYQSIFQKTPHDIGPGQYKTIQIINKDGHHTLAKYEDSHSRRFARSARFQYTKPKTPGPGAYNQSEKTVMNNTGWYFNSRFKSKGSNAFGRSQRPFLGQKTLSPGPGKQQSFSQLFSSVSFSEFNSTMR